MPTDPTQREALSREEEQWNEEARTMGVIGQHGRIVGDHPWSGHAGEVVRVAYTLAGWGVVVRLDDEDGQECFVFDGKLWKQDAPNPHVKLDLGPGWTQLS